MKSRKKFVFWLVAGAIILALAVIFVVNIPNIKIGRMIASGHYYALNNYLPRAEGRVNHMLGLIGKAMAGSNFNNYDAANGAIDELLDSYAGSLGEETRASLAGLKLANLFVANRYAQFCALYDSYSAAIQLDSTFLSIVPVCRALAAQPALSVEKPDGEVTIPVAFKTTGRGEAIYFDALIDGEVQQFAFDTGAMKWNMTSDSLARALGMRIVLDSMRVDGVTGGAVCRIGILNRMTIGQIAVSNAVFVIAPDSMATVKRANGSVVRIGNVLGTDIMAQLKEIRIRATEGRIVVPAEQSAGPGAQNLMCATGSYYLFPQVNGKILKMHFDTGNVKTNFFARYYDDNKSDVEKRGRLEHTEVGGFGGTAEVTQYVLPTVDIAIGGIGRTFAQVAVVLDPQSPQSDEYGSLGADFVKAYGEVTVNFEKMFVTVR